MEYTILFEKIFKKHKESLKFLNIKNDKKLIMAFVGIPGSGKTSISEILEKKLKANRINSIDVQKYIEEIKEDIKYSDMIIDKRKYIFWLMSRISKSESNKLIVLDKGIERTYEETMKWIKDNKYKSVIVVLKAPDSVLKKRLLEREGENAENYFREFSRWKKEFKEFMKKYTPDIVLDTGKLNEKECAEKILNLVI